jgi:O-antigen/teichoic acid export membrane protein
MDDNDLTPSSARYVAGNAAAALAGEIVSKAAGFLLVVILARNLSEVDYGYFFFGISFVPLLLQFARWGLSLVTVREVAADRTKLSSVFVNGFAVRLMLAGLAAGLACLLVPLFIETPTGILAVSIIAVALFLDELTEFIGGVFVAFERMRLNAVSIVTNRVVSTGLAVGVIAAGGELVAVTIAFALGSLAGLTISAILLRRRFPPVHRTDFRRSRARQLLRHGTPYGFSALLNMGVFRIDAVMLQAMVGAAAVGTYGVAYRFFEPLLFASWALGGLVLPRLVRDHASDRRTDTFSVVIAVLLVIYLPIAVGAPFAASSLIVELFSAQYAPATSAVLWLTSASVFYAVAHQSRTALVAVGARGTLVWTAGSFLAFNVALNLVLIPRYSFTGAAAATFTTEVIEAVVLLGLYLRAGGRLELGVIHVVPVVAVAAMAATLLGSGWRGLAAVGASLVVYPLALVVATHFLAPGLLSRARAALRPSRAEPEEDVSGGSKPVR